MSEDRKYTSPLRHVVREAAEIGSDVEAEIAFHLEMRERALVAEGLEPEAAREQARREFGDAAALRAKLARADRGVSRRASRLQWLEEVWQDTRSALRTFVRAPLFVVMALSTLVVGIGSAVAMFTVVNAVLLRPLPYPEAERLVRVSPGQVFNTTLTAQIRDRAEALESAAGIALFTFTLTGHGEPAELMAQVVAPEFFEVVGTQPGRGRAFEERERSAAVVVISDALWRGRFGGDPDIIGRQMPLDGYSGSVTQTGPTSREIVGVMPRGFEPPALRPGVEVDLWIPLRPVAASIAADSSWYVDTLIGRLRPGATLEQATAQVRAAMSAAREETSGIIGEDAVVTASVVGLLDSMVGDTRRALWMLLGAVGLVLVLACTNLANLLLARGERRRQELATRAALGGTRGRLLRELLTESALLALLGALGGVLLARTLLSLLQVGAASGLPRADALALDGRVILFTAALTALTLVLFALLPALRITAGDLRPDLGSASRTRGRSPGSRRFGFTLMTLEVALAMMLVTGAGLLLGTLRSLHAIDPGMSAEDVLSLRVVAPPAVYSGARARTYYDDVEARLRALPGVRSVGAIHLLPMTVGNWSFPYLAEGQQPPANAPLPSANFRVVTDGYFDALDVPIVEGRAFGTADAGGSPVGMINRALAELLWPGQPAVGREILLFGNTPFRVVGVVENVRQHGLDQGAEPEMYRPFHQFTLSTMYIAVEVDGDPAAHAEAAQRAVWELDANVPVEARPLTDIVADSLAGRRFFAGVLTFFGLLALILGGIGVYGVMSFMISTRMPEFAVRSAMGATRPELLRTALHAPGLALIVGLAVGGAAAVAAGRVIESLLFGVQPGEPWILLTAALVLAALGLLASWAPALRAARTEPARLLRG